MTLDYTSIREEIATSPPLAAPRNDMVIDGWVHPFYRATNFELQTRKKQDVKTSCFHYLT